MRALPRTGVKSPFSAPLVTVLKLAVLVCSQGLQPAHLAVTQQLTRMCTARYWALQLQLGAKVLHGVGTKCGVLKLAQLRGCLELGCQAGQLSELLHLCCGGLVPGNVPVSHTACTVCERFSGVLQQLQCL